MKDNLMLWHGARLVAAEEAEALALLEGFRLAEQWPESTPVVFESDCANLVQKMESKGMDRSVISAMIMDIKQGMASHASCTVRKIWREQNKIAHNLAKFALKTRRSQVSFSVVPPCIQDLVLFDRIHCQNFGDIT
jgi:hypothetical protein